MGHYAKVENGIVTTVIVAKQDFINTLPDKELYIKTSYNTYGGVHYQSGSDKTIPDGGTPIRKNFASQGFTYDAVRDAFIPPKPTEGNWTLNENTCLWE